MTTRKGTSVPEKVGKDIETAPIGAVPTKPSSKPKEGHEWVLTQNPKGKGYMEALLDGGTPEVEARAKTESKYPSKWVEKKIALGDRNNAINALLNGIALFHRDQPDESIPSMTKPLHGVMWEYVPRIIKETGKDQVYNGKRVYGWTQTDKAYTHEGFMAVLDSAVRIKANNKA